MYLLPLVSLLPAVLAASSASTADNTNSATSASSANSGSSTTSSSSASDTTLTNKRYTYPDLPYQVDTSDGPRGLMQGYNMCNSTTENQDSMCVTGWMNNISDWCVWGSPTVNGLIADVEGETVAWCSNSGHGSRIIPNGAIRGVQWLTTPDYVQIAGVIDQAAIDLASNDTGGEMDPWGADYRGNPIGSLVFSTAFSNSSSSIQQVIYWNNFMGNNYFCFKACNPSSTQGTSLCQHTYDEVGCQYNIIADYANLEGKFETCDSDNALPVGVYVGTDGITSTWTQPPESVTNYTIPYTPSIPSSSNCVTYTSTQIFTAGVTVSAASGVSTEPLSSTLGTMTSGKTSDASATGSGDTSAKSESSGAPLGHLDTSTVTTVVLPLALTLVTSFFYLL